VHRGSGNVGSCFADNIRSSYPYHKRACLTYSQGAVPAKVVGTHATWCSVDVAMEFAN
jgi:hypothetical protein